MKGSGNESSGIDVVTGYFVQSEYMLLGKWLLNITWDILATRWRVKSSVRLNICRLSSLLTVEYRAAYVLLTYTTILVKPSGKLVLALRSMETGEVIDCYYRLH